LPINDNRANNFVIFEQGDANEASGSREFNRRETQFVIVGRLEQKVGHLVWLLCLQEQTQSDSSICPERPLRAQKVNVSGRCTLRCCSDSEKISFAEPQIAKFGSAYADRVVQHGLEYRLELTRRA